MKTYQKLLGASCLALYLVGCGSGGGAESPVEISKNSKGEFQISSKVDSVTIQGVKLNRGNCVVRFFSGLNRFSFVDISNNSIQDVSNSVVSMQDLKDMIRFGEEIIEVEKTNYGTNFNFPDAEKKLANIKNRLSQLKRKDVMMEPQTLKFGESLSGYSRGCDTIEATIQTDKGAWTFNFDR